MRKIRITESQYKRLKKSLKEAFNVDVTQQLERKGNARDAWQEVKQQNPMLQQSANNGEVTATFNPDALDETKIKKVYTKKQIKEARAKKLQESTIHTCKKKSLTK